MFTVYVIRSASDRQYTGYTSNIEKRLAEHNSGQCKTTCVDHGWHVVYSEIFQTRGEAMKREKWLKTGNGRHFVESSIAGWSPPSAE